MVVDTMAPYPLNISFDFTFPAIPCPEVRIDAMDVTGEQQVNVLRNVYKQRLSLSGDKLGSAYLDKADADEYRMLLNCCIHLLKWTLHRDYSWDWYFTIES